MSASYRKDEQNITHIALMDEMSNPNKPPPMTAMAVMP